MMCLQVDKGGHLFLLLSFFKLTWHELESSEKKEHQLRKYPD